MKVIADYLSEYNLELQSFKKLEGYGSENYRIESNQGETCLLKIYPPTESLELIKAEINLIKHISENLSIQFTTTLPNKNGALLTRLQDGSHSRLLHYVDGNCLHASDMTEDLLYKLGETIAQLHTHAPVQVPDAIKARTLSWDLQQINVVAPYLKHISNPQDQRTALYFLDAFQHRVIPYTHELEKRVIHNDLNEQNIIIRNGQLAGIIDFGDTVHGPLIFDLGICLCYLLMSCEDHDKVLRSCLAGYAKHRSLSKASLDALYFIIGARLSVSVLHAAQAKAKNTDTDYVLGSEKSAWALMYKWLTISPVYLKQLSYKIFDIADHEYDPDKIETRRNTTIAPSLSTSYKTSIHFHSAAFQYMYDQFGNTYLDAYNNIPIVGHTHPQISKVISDQLRKLNTNSRYQYEALGSYAEKLLSVCPDHLSKVIFVNSGSAASDLAIRIARTYTKNHDVGIIEHGYHGNTNLGIDISAYKHNGKGGSGKKDFVLHLPMSYKDQDAIEAAKKMLSSHRAQPACIIAEPISGCGGQVPIDKKFLHFLQSHCHENNIVFIVDEVQTGFGRIGSHFWAHQQQGLSPDMMVLGKSIGNGHPLGAVVMTETLADAFDNGMEFFSSFGGNPVSCLVGETVLDIIESENLQAKALDTGDYFLDILKQVQNTHPEIFDLRGSGLFLGIELYENDQPGTHLAKYVKEYFKTNFVLTSTDGAHDNVLKIKPPLCFNKANADQYAQLLNQALIDFKQSK